MGHVWLLTPAGACNSILGNASVWTSNMRVCGCMDAACFSPMPYPHPLTPLKCCLVPTNSPARGPIAHALHFIFDKSAIKEISTGRLVCSVGSCSLQRPPEGPAHLNNDPRSSWWHPSHRSTLEQLRCSIAGDKSLTLSVKVVNKVISMGKVCVTLTRHASLAVKVKTEPLMAC